MLVVVTARRVVDIFLRQDRRVRVFAIIEVLARSSLNKTIRGGDRMRLSASLCEKDIAS